MSTTTDKELVITCQYFAAMCRLQHLQTHKWGANIDGIIIPLNAEDEAEFQRLMDWWRNLGMANQVKMHDLAKKFAHAVNRDGGRKSNAVEEAVKKIIVAPNG